MFRHWLLDHSFTKQAPARLLYKCSAALQSVLCLRCGRLLGNVAAVLQGGRRMFVGRSKWSKAPCGWWVWVVLCYVWFVLWNVRLWMEIWRFSAMLHVFWFGKFSLYCFCKRSFFLIPYPAACWSGTPAVWFHSLIFSSCEVSWHCKVLTNPCHGFWVWGLCHLLLSDAASVVVRYRQSVWKQSISLFLPIFKFYLQFGFGLLIVYLVNYFLIVSDYIFYLCKNLHL